MSNVVSLQVQLLFVISESSAQRGFRAQAFCEVALVQSALHCFRCQYVSALLAVHSSVHYQWSALEACSLQLCKHAKFIKEIIDGTLYEASHFSFTNPAANHSYMRLDVGVCHSAPLPLENSSRFHFILSSCFAACKNW